MIFQPHLLKHITQARVKNIYIHLFLKSFGAALYGIFEPIIFYQILGQNLSYVLLFYGIQSLVYFLFVQIGTRVVEKIGIKKSMIIGTIFLVIFRTIVFLLSSQHSTNKLTSVSTLLLFISLTACLTLSWTFYWPAYHMYLSFFIKKREQGEAVGITYALSIVPSIIAPILGAFILTSMGITSLILTSTLFVVLSVFSLFWGPDRKVKVSFSFFDFFTTLFNKKNWSSFASFFGEGIEGYIAGTFWGLFVYILLRSYTSLGLISSGVALFNAVFVWWLGKMCDSKKQESRKLLNLGVFLNLTGWLLKGLPTSGVLIYLSDNFQNVGRNTLRIPYDTIMYKKFKTDKKFTDEFVILREMAYHFLGGIALILIALFLMIWDIKYIAFVVAALSTLLYLNI